MQYTELLNDLKLWFVICFHQLCYNLTQNYNRPVIILLNHWPYIYVSEIYYVEIWLCGAWKPYVEDTILVRYDAALYCRILSYSNVKITNFIFLNSEVFVVLKTPFDTFFQYNAPLRDQTVDSSFCVVGVWHCDFCALVVPVQIIDT